MGAIRYSCPIRLVPTYILPAKDIRLLGKFQPDSFKAERLVCVEKDGQTDMARSTRLIMLIKNICIYFTGSETSPSLRCKLLTEINIPSARVLKVQFENDSFMLLMNYHAKLTHLRICLVTINFTGIYTIKKFPKYK